VDSRDELGRSPLMKAIINGHSETMDVLLGAGADPGLTDEHSWSSLFFAARNSMEPHWAAIVARLLPDLSMDHLLHRDTHDRTALMYVRPG
jgi:Ankyrin repeat